MPLTPARPLDIEIEDRLFARLAAGETLTAICRDKGMPTRELVYANLKAYPEFAAKYAEARSLGHDAMAEGVLSMVDAEPRLTPKGLIDNGDIALRRLRMDSRLKLLPHWDRRYAEKIDVGNREGEKLEVKAEIETADLTREINEALLMKRLADGKGE